MQTTCNLLRLDRVSRWNRHSSMCRGGGSMAPDCCNCSSFHKLVTLPCQQPLLFCFFQVHNYFKWFLVLGSSWWYLVFLLHVGFPILNSQTLLEVYKLIEEERFLTLKTTECSLWFLSLACKLHLQQPTKPWSVHSYSKPSKKELA
jgi:hypothetical protein